MSPERVEHPGDPGDPRRFPSRWAERSAGGGGVARAAPSSAASHRQAPSCRSTHTGTQTDSEWARGEDALVPRAALLLGTPLETEWETPV